jgi:DNA-binding HxlR family transcriptional regulator
MTPGLSAQLRANTEQKVLVALKLRGPLSFHKLMRVIANVPFREMDNALKRLSQRGWIRPSAPGPAAWHLTPEGLAQIPVLAPGESVLRDDAPASSVA